MSENQYFRAGTGSVIYNGKGEILIFSRQGKPNIWQHQQGGMDGGEEVEDTLWRELEEETALLKEDFSEVTSYPDWLFYQYSPEIKKSLKYGRSNSIGQIHKWFFLKLKENVIIDLSKTKDKEFGDFKWSTFDDLQIITDSLKFEVYDKLRYFFNEKIRPGL